MAAFFAGVFLLCLLTVEPHQNSTFPWLKSPGFLETDSEAALADSHGVTVEISEAVNYVAASYDEIFLNQTKLFLHIYRGPPSLEA